MLLWLHGCILCAVCSVKSYDETVSEHVYVAQESYIPSKQAERLSTHDFHDRAFEMRCGDEVMAA